MVLIMVRFTHSLTLFQVSELCFHIVWMSGGMMFSGDEGGVMGFLVMRVRC